jgi:hypothetical protein
MVCVLVIWPFRVASPLFLPPPPFSPFFLFFLPPFSEFGEIVIFKSLTCLVCWPLPLGFGLGGRLLLARRGRVCVYFIIITSAIAP